MSRFSSNNLGIIQARMRRLNARRDDQHVAFVINALNNETLFTMDEFNIDEDAKRWPSREIVQARWDARAIRWASGSGAEQKTTKGRL